MINPKAIASEIGTYSTIKVPSYLIEGITNSRLNAKDVLNDNFSNYSYILNKFPETDINAIYIIGSKEHRCIKFNIHRYLDYIFKYFGSNYNSDVYPQDYIKEFRGKITQLESAKKIQDIYKISPFMFRNLCDRIKSAIFNMNESQKYKNYLNYAFKTYCLDGGEIPDDLKVLIDKVLMKYKEMEVKTLSSLLNDMQDRFDNLSFVPSHYLSNVSEFDFKLLIAFIALSTDNIKNKNDIQEFIDFLMKDNVYNYLNSYNLSFSIIHDGEKREVNLDFSDIIFSDNVYSLKKKEKIETKVEMPKLKSEVLKSKIISKNDVVQLPKSFFQEMQPGEFIEKISNSKRKIRKIDYERNIDPEEMFQKKIDLYSLIDAEKLFMGTDSFDGYFGFQLPNGYVVLDKFFADSAQNIISISDAIYVVSLEDFEKINLMSKTETFRAMKDGLINGTRWYHAADWEDKVMNLAFSDENTNISFSK